MDLTALVSRFALRGTVTDVRPLGEGFINDTYKVYVDGGSEPAYILQRKNHVVFPDVPAMMENIVAVTRHIKTKVADPERGTLTVVPSLDGRWYVNDEAGNFWAVCTFIPGSVGRTAACTASGSCQMFASIGLPISVPWMRMRESRSKRFHSSIGM